MSIQKPIIHLNGDSANTLVEQYCTAMGAINDALTALKGTSPHPRNYYVDPEPGAWSRAVDQYMHRLDMLNRVKAELEELAKHCSEFMK